GDVIGRQLRGVVGGIGVEVEGNAELLRRLEAPVDVAALVPIHIWTAAEYPEPRLERLAQQVFRDRVVEDALLRERDQLQVEHAERLVAGGVQGRAEALDAAVADRDILPASADEAAA